MTAAALRLHSARDVKTLWLQGLSLFIVNRSFSYSAPKAALVLNEMVLVLVLVLVLDSPGSIESEYEYRPTG